MITKCGYVSKKQSEEMEKEINDMNRLSYLEGILIEPYKPPDCHGLQKDKLPREERQRLLEEFLNSDRPTPPPLFIETPETIKETNRRKMMISLSKQGKTIQEISKIIGIPNEDVECYLAFQNWSKEFE